MSRILGVLVVLLLLLGGATPSVAGSMYASGGEDFAEVRSSLGLSPVIPGEADREDFGFPVSPQEAQQLGELVARQAAAKEALTALRGTPAFGGAYFDVARGQLVVWVVDDRPDIEATKSRISGLLQRVGLTAEVRRSPFTMSDLDEMGSALFERREDLLAGIRVYAVTADPTGPALELLVDAADVDTVDPVS